ncbi:hypothetical protein BDR04DRAFT_1231118 [Suillus decipiens]|nr:hypothetical protein BDR04DRAFT_1231118 [Suillus decipiens]
MAKDTPSDKADEDDLDWGEQTEPESTPRRRKKKPNKQHELPRWQAVDIVTLLSSDNEEDDLEITENVPKFSRNDTSPLKRKRDRSRSRSITPPPQLPIEVRRTAVAAKNTPEQGGGPELVIIKVRWQPHPLNTAGAKDVWNFKMKRHDTFQSLFEELADLAAVLVDHLVVSHDGKRLFASGTPHGLRIWAEGELEACDQTTWDYIRAQRHQQAPKADQSSNNPLSPERG